MVTSLFSIDNSIHIVKLSSLIISSKSSFISLKNHLQPDFIELNADENVYFQVRKNINITSQTETKLINAHLFFFFF